jgi:hypothetical protein
VEKRSMNDLEQEILGSFRKKSENCKFCKKYCSERKLEKKGPLSFFNIGGNFGKDKYSIVFVGKNHWYQRKDIEELKRKNSIFPGPGTTFYDCRKDGKEMFKSGQSAYWRYTLQIAEQIYPDLKDDPPKLLENIAITNLTKCNTSQDSNDTTPYDLTEKCRELLNEEIKILNPKHLVFFTGKGYDEYIDDLDFGYLGSAIDVNGTDRFSKRKVGNLEVYWWERRFSDGNCGRNLFMLRTRHPQRAPAQLANEIVHWIRNTL